MKIRLTLLIAASLVVAVANPAYANTISTVGVRHLTVAVPARGGTIDVAVWYPTTAHSPTIPGSAELIGDTAIFQGVMVARGAPMANGPLPLILLSHGGLRAAPNQSAWIAARLAAAGFMVAVPRQTDPRQQAANTAPREIWLRPADLSATLTAIEADALLGGKVDPHRIGAVGFQLGGTAVLALAGARLDAARYAHSCDRPSGNPDCAWFTRAGVDLKTVDATQVSQSHLDPRIRMIVAVDPEQSANIAPATLAGVTIPVTLINLGAPDVLPPDMNAVTLARDLPHAQYEVVTDATSFSAFNICKPEAAERLRLEEEGDALCVDGGHRSRAAIHAQLGEMIITLFKDQLGQGR